MVKIFLDTNVVLDILGKREPFYGDAKSFLELHANGLARLQIAECSLGNLYDLAFNVYKLPHAEFTMSELIMACEIVSGGKQAIYGSLNSTFKDKEDALQYYTALANKSDFLITRDKKDFKYASDIPVMTPNEFFSS
ncbi:PIN domain-containing protein [Algoriphagus aestuariicola]|jgi:predicted nucleic acid-binding protein|uniref:PIN domain-containing protein n=1 Tax=Algoriphagus aestuariicola TaxID=1852016 RepID=A0ABS3BTJ4_9BACT|nr:PIN domain-containing protein [Algoriphagus aestuariicola]MBN7802448.1 PIN domain-containing protein [Algoriphagus aestuariicola]